MWLCGIFMMTNLLSMLGSVFVCDIHADADSDKDEVGEDGGDTCEERDTRGEMSSVYLHAASIILQESSQVFGKYLNIWKVSLLFGTLASTIIIPGVNPMGDVEARVRGGSW